MGSCTLIPTPGKGWEKVFEEIQPNQNVNIYFQAGIYPLDKKIELKDIKNLSISGVGSGTQLIALKDETALLLQNCENVTIRDIQAESRVIGSVAKTEHLQGILTFVACGNITVENVSLSSAAGLEKNATCITVIDSYENVPTEDSRLPESYVRIRHCDLEIGSRQSGILLVNVKRAQVEDNVLQGKSKIQSTQLKIGRKNKQLIRSLGRSLVATVILGDQPDENATTNEIVTHAELTVRFKTNSFLHGKWQSIIDKYPPTAITDRRDLSNYIIKTAEKIIYDADFRKEIGVPDSSIKNLAENKLSVGLQGIVVGGSRVDEIRILNNTIKNILQGLHIGVSSRSSGDSVNVQSGIVFISGNKIDLTLNSGETKGRHGIFVGNSDSLIVENNYIKVNRLTGKDQVPVEGIRIWGYLGRLMSVKQNHLVNFTTGILFKPLNVITDTKNQWIIEDNMAAHTANGVSVILPDDAKEKKPVRVAMNLS